MNEQTMGQRIAARRKLLNLSQEALAEQLDISRQAISKWESDGAIPEIDKLIALSKLYNVSVGWLLGVEETENSAADTLSDTQLKLVEELVKKQNNGSRLLCHLAAVLAGLLAMVLIFTWIYPQNSAPSPDYSTQISDLETNYSTIQAQIDRLDVLLNAQQETGILLRSYVPQSISLSDDLSSVDITFYFFPRVYHENLTAYLSIFNPATKYSDVLECRWAEDRYLVHATLPLADHYLYSFLLVSDTGYQEQILDSSTYFTDLLSHSGFYISEEHPQYDRMKSGESAPISANETLYRFDAPIYAPRIQEKTGFVPFDDVAISLLLNGEALWEADYSEAFLELYRQENVAVPLTPDIQVQLPALADGDRLILQLTATTHTGRTMTTILDDLTAKPHNLSGTE
jgi:transcriptional regulator with XRE-family HTH domain